MSDKTYTIQQHPGPNPPGGRPPGDGSPPPPHVVVQVPPPRRNWTVRILGILLVLACLYIVQLQTERAQYYSGSGRVSERYHSGAESATDRIVRIEVTGTIMPPYSTHTIKSLQQAAEDDRVKGVLLVVDSPGGLVSDSHQIYHAVRQLSAKKPVYVSMKSIAASGGYYISMGIGTEGQIFAEETTWTGSIGVVLPRYNAAALAQKLGVASDPIKTGKFKDSLSPFRDLSEDEREMWGVILEESHARFIDLIDETRENLDREQVAALATGQVFTASQALGNGLIDAIGFEEDALAALQKELGLTDVRVVTYYRPPTPLDVLLGNATAQSPEEQWRSWMELTVPRAMYFCSWLPTTPPTP